MQNKGFTLVELVVVLVIIALMSAAIAPGILGYIDDMQNKSYINDARMAVNSAQSELMDVYQSGKAVLSPQKKAKWKTRMEYGDDIHFYFGCAAVTGGNEKNAFTIDKALFEEDGVRVLYSGGEYKVLDKEEASGTFPFEMTDTVASNTLIVR